LNSTIVVDDREIFVDGNLVDEELCRLQED
jgi:hypothetical protein